MRMMIPKKREISGTRVLYIVVVARPATLPHQPRRLIVAPAAVGCMRLLAGASGRKIGTMPKAAQDVLADALRLEPDSRAEVAAELLASLDGPAEPDAEAAWDAEIERRITAIEAGTIRLEPWAEVKRRIERDVLGR
jgi:putative addiction module component (TIGR02574 family)